MEISGEIITGLLALFALLMGGFAQWKIGQASKKEAADRGEIEKLTENAHGIIIVEVEEDHQEVTEALEQSDKAAAIADLFNDRRD